MTVQKRKAATGILLAGVMAACLLLTEVYRGAFQGYSAALETEEGEPSIEKQLYDATNTYKYIEYAGHDYTADYVTENGAKCSKTGMICRQKQGNP